MQAPSRYWVSTLCSDESNLRRISFWSTDSTVSVIWVIFCLTDIVLIAEQSGNLLNNAINPFSIQLWWISVICENTLAHFTHVFFIKLDFVTSNIDAMR